LVRRTSPSRGPLAPPLGRDDAERLIEMYVGAFAERLMLSEAERAPLAAYLRTTAEPEIDPAFSNTLAVCP
jgi:hypothetical protein